MFTLVSNEFGVGFLNLVFQIFEHYNFHKTIVSKINGGNAMQVLRTKSEEDPQYCRDVGRSENWGGAVVTWWVLSAHLVARVQNMVVKFGLSERHTKICALDIP